MNLERRTDRMRSELIDQKQRLRVVFESGKDNRFDMPLISDVTSLMQDAQDHPDLKVVSFESAGPDFSLGFAPEDHRRSRAPGVLRAFHGMVRAIDAVSVPVAVLARGRCMGAGLELALLASWIFAHDYSNFGLPDIRAGALAPLAAVLLPIRVGQARADTLYLTGRTITAREALELGLIEDVSGSPEAAFAAFASANVYVRSASSIRQGYRAVRKGIHRALHEELTEIEHEYIDELLGAKHDAAIRARRAYSQA